jgi:hypothetical protein
MRSAPTAAMEVLLNLTLLNLLIMVETRMALYRLQITKQPSVLEAETGLLSIQKIVNDPIPEMRVDHIIPVFKYSRTFRVIIDPEYWRSANLVVPENTLAWFTDRTRGSTGMGSGIFGIRPNRSLSIPWVNSPQSFRLKYMPYYNAHVRIQEELIETSRFLFFLTARLHLGH